MACYKYVLKHEKVSHIDAKPFHVAVGMEPLFELFVFKQKRVARARLVETALMLSLLVLQFLYRCFFELSALYLL